MTYEVTMAFDVVPTRAAWPTAGGATDVRISTTVEAAHIMHVDLPSVCRLAQVQVEASSRPQPHDPPTVSAKHVELRAIDIRVKDARALREDLALEAERQARLKAPSPGTPTDRSDG
jgi:hypothetical protein